MPLRILRTSFLVGAVLLCLAPPPAAAAEIVLSGDIDALFDVQPDDCPACTATQRGWLEEGLDYALTVLRNQSWNPYGAVCVAEASLIREMAVMTFEELVRPGSISVNRWRELLRAKATIAGELSSVTVEGLLRAPEPEFVSRHEVGDALFLALYSSIFDAIAAGQWSYDQWTAAAAGTRGNFNPWIDSMLEQMAGSPLYALSRHFAATYPGGIWLLGQGWHLTELPADFVNAATSYRASQLHSDFDAAVTANPYTAGTNGCGAATAWALKRAARAKFYGQVSGVMIGGASADVAKSRGGGGGGPIRTTISGVVRP